MENYDSDTIETNVLENETTDVLENETTDVLENETGEIIDPETGEVVPAEPAEISPEDRELTIVDDYPKHDFGDFKVVDDIGLTLKKVMSGSFYMGSNDGPYNERPMHRVSITRPFWMGLYPVTQDEFKLIMGKNPSNFQG